MRPPPACGKWEYGKLKLRFRLTSLSLLTLSALLIFAAVACAQPEPESVVFMAGYKPQANLPFAAAYIAQEKGFFEEQGLDVEIRHAIQRRAYPASDVWRR